jgi:flagellar assembly protein FliH
MSELWTADAISTAARVPIWTKAIQVQNFTPWGSHFESSDEEPVWSSQDHDPSPVINPTDARTAAFTEGFEEGVKAAEDAFREERAALTALAQSIETLQPEPSRELGMLLAETVDRLVRQIVGEVTIDKETLLERANAAAEVVSEQAGTMRLKLHPDDAERLSDAQLSISMVPDAHLAPGTLILETGDGWVEDGPEVRLDKLRAALDRLGIGR